LEQKRDVGMRLKRIIYLVPFLLVSCLNPGDGSDSQLTTELKAIDAYLQTATFVKVTEDNNTGIRIGVTTFGSGAPPHTGQVIDATFVGHLLSDWSVFETIHFNDKIDNISGVGLKYGVASLPEGSTATIFIASNYGFGPNGTSTVPPNATIAYEVVLDKVTMTSAELTQFQTDTLAIHKYITDSAIVATQLPSGVWYKISAQGTGSTSPNVYDYVSFHYKGSALKTGIVFQEGEVTTQRIFNFIDGFKIGLPLLKLGDVATFYIPSGLGYGPAGNTAINPNTNLIFEVKLTSIN